MHPVLIDFGFFQLPSYGVMLILGVSLGLWTLSRRARAAGMDQARLVDLALWAIIWALIGSKLLLVLVELPRFLRDPAELLTLIRAGGVFLGGLVTAVIAIAFLMRRYGLSFLPTADVAVPSVALGHAVGRIGCLLAGCCYGGACDLPWAITYTSERAARLLGTPLHTPVHPFPIYAALFNLALYLVLSGLYRRRLRAGRVFATYLVAYGIGRSLLELTRGDAVRGFLVPSVLSTSQFIGVVMIVAGVAVHIGVGRRER